MNRWVCFAVLPAVLGLMFGLPLRGEDSRITGKYEDLLNNPLISGAIVWEDGSGAVAYAGWPSGKKSQLIDLCNGIDADASFPIDHPPDLTDDLYFSEEDAWMIFLTHVAHSLWLEANRIVSWSLTDLTGDQLSCLLDCRKLIKYYGPDQYHFENYPGLGRVTDWNIRFSYDFMVIHDFIKSTQDSTVHAFASWCRTYVRHISGSYSNPDGYETLYGYRGYPLVNRILDPLPETWGHISAGCWGTTGLFSAVMRSVNIPVVHGYSIFSAPGSGVSAHSRIELPTLGKGLCHSDDLYNAVCLPKGNLVPTELLFTTLDWLEEYISNPATLDVGDTYTNNMEEQAMYNACKYLLTLAVEYLTDYLLYQRARDENESTPPTALENALIGPSVGGSIVEFAKPYFPESERQDILSRVDDELKRLGSGSWDAGKQIVQDRWYAPYEKDDYNTGVDSWVSVLPASFILSSNFPNPFNAETVIRFELSGHTTRELTITVHDMLGRQIRQLAHGRHTPGAHTVRWDGKDALGRSMSSGIYLCRLRTGYEARAHRMVLLR